MPDTRLDTSGVITEMENALLGVPGVSRCRVVLNDSGSTTGYVVPWGRRSPNSDGEIAASVSGVNRYETLFLHDEIFEDEAYLANGIVLREGAVVFDVGANIGLFSVFVAARCPSARVLAFEPVPSTYRCLRENVERYGVTAELFELGLGAGEDEVLFDHFEGMSIMSCATNYAEFDKSDLVRTYVDNSRTSGPTGRDDHLDTLARLADVGFTPTQVRCRLRPLSAVAAENGVETIDLLKVDVQRAELDVLHGIGDEDWARVQQVAIEVHDEPGTETEGRLPHVTALLHARGFEVTSEEEPQMRSTGRYALQAIRPSYRADSRPVVASAGGSPSLDAWTVHETVRDRHGTALVPDTVYVVNDLAAVPTPTR